MKTETHIQGSELQKEVSIIIPFFNNHDEVEEIVHHIKNQTYPEDKAEIICIDNCSTAGHSFSDTFLENVILLKECAHKNSPYSARNRGIERSTGEIIVFIDANSYPDKRWLEYGVQHLQANNYDLIAGAVAFDFGKKVTAAKITDALTSINIKKSVEERGVAYTANLFVKKEIFVKTGLFEEGVRSGGDVRWTSLAAGNGYKLGYCENAAVYKKARGAITLYQKKIRTGRGYFFTWKEEAERKIWFYNFFRSLKPPRFSEIEKINPERYRPEFNNKRFSVWFHLYLTGIIEQLAFMYQYFAYTLGRQRDIDRREEMIEKGDV